MRLISDEPIDREAFSTTLENAEGKKLNAIQILEDLIVIHEGANDEKYVERSNDCFFAFYCFYL